MRSLFFKIFFCFWLSHLIVVSLLYVLITASQGEREEVRRFGPQITVTSSDLTKYARQAAAKADNAQALQAYLEGLQKQTGLRAALFDTGGKLIAGESRREAGGVVREAARSGEVEFAPVRGGVISAHRAATPHGNYVFTLSWGRGGPGRGGPRGPMLSFFGWRLDRGLAYEAARLVAVFIAAGLVAFGLARYLTSPTIQLRRATRQLAAGDLSARVGPHMGRRRDELADLGHDFDLMAARIEELMLSQRRLLGDISHELGSPLARLNVALELAGQGADEETRGYLARIERESSRLDMLIGQLLTLTRLENARQAAPDEKNAGEVVDMARLVEDICADADFEAQSRHRAVRLVANEACHVEGNPELLRSAIENVVRNAILHTPEATEIELSLHVQPARDDAGKKVAIVSVRDHGPGVPPEALSELFRPFYRVTEARDRQSGGVGLGLSITERAVHFHDGAVTAENAPEGGLLITICLPATAEK